MFGEGDNFYAKNSYNAAFLALKLRIWVKDDIIHDKTLSARITTEIKTNVERAI